jgi:hypothetical protein
MGGGKSKTGKGNKPTVTLPGNDFLARVKSRKVDE